MAYIGRGLDKISNIEVLDAITFTNSAGPYNLTKDSTAFVPTSANALVISIDGVVQSPDSYTTSAATITFDSSMSSASTNNFIYQIGAGVITSPSDASVTAAKLATDAVETAKIKDLNVTVGKLPASVNLSTKTVTLPASVSGLGTGITNAQLAGSIDVTTKITGTVPTANLGSGTASSSTYLAGDQTYKTIVAVDIAWQAVTTAATLAATAGKGYPIDTTSNGCTVTLPASASVGDQIIFTDYARNWGTNALTINQNSLNYQGQTSPNPVYDIKGESVHIVYMDTTKGWIPINDGAVADEVPQTYSADMLVVGGGAGTAGNEYGGGGGAGGFRTSTQSLTEGEVYTVVVGDGGAGNTSTTTRGGAGNDSSISGTAITTITSTGGGGGGAYDHPADTQRDGGDGGSGGGGGGHDTSGGSGGSGNTPSTSPSQGEDGGAGQSGSPYQGGGGGGAGAVGAAGSSTGNGGNGSASTITGSSVTYAGGGGGSGSGVQGTGGTGGGGDATASGSGNNGTANLGGGGGATQGSLGGSGGKGVVILNVPDAKYSGTTTGSPTVTTGQGSGSDETVIKFTGDGTYTA